jgi:hypothetical protein
MHMNMEMPPVTHTLAQSSTLQTIRKQRKKKMVNKLAHRDLIHRGTDRDTLVWTDRSRTKGKAGYGVYFSANSPLNTLEQAVGDQTSDNAELQATLQALEITADTPNIHIIMDNEVVCTLVNKLINHPHQRSIHTRRLVEKRIQEEVASRATRGWET